MHVRSILPALACSIIAGCGSHSESVFQSSGASLLTAPALQAGQRSGESTFKVFPLDRKNDASAVASDLGGNEWFTDFRTSRIGRVSASGVVTEYQTPTPFSRPDDIVAGPDGDMWFTEFNGGRIGRVAADGSITEIHAHHFSNLYNICVGPDGALWFTGVGSGGQMVGRMTTTGQTSEFPVPAAEDITAGPDGNLWISGGNSVFRMTTAGGITQFKTRDDATLGDLVFGADGNLWFWFWSPKVDYGIGKLTTVGAFKEYPLGSNHLVTDITSAYGRIWLAYSHSSGSGLAEVDEFGRITEHFAPQCDVSLGVALGADGEIWFTCYKSIDAFSPM
jgi:streptogramin lyase